MFNDFGDSHEVLDMNGEELKDCLIQTISCEEKGFVELMSTNRHDLQDGDEVHFVNVDGMKLREGEKQPEENKDCKSGGINDTVWKVKSVKNMYGFYIGDTRCYSDYTNNGIMKPLRMK
jgi:hypothetical protein